MSALTIPDSFTPGTTALSAQVNANFNQIVTWSTTIDHSNTVNSTGFWASDIKPLTAAEATFGATATGVGYKFLANDATATPLTVAGVSSQSVDIFDVTLTSGGTKAVFVNSGGALGFGATNAGLPSGPSIAGTAGGSLILNTAASQSLFFSSGVAGVTTLLTVSASGVTFPNLGGGGLTSAAQIVGGGTGNLILNTTTGQNFLFTTAGSTVANINSATGVYTATSDTNLKENVADLALGLEALLQLRPVSYDWISTKEPGQGFLAQDVRKIVPLAVMAIDKESDTLGITDSMLTPVVVKAIQELAAELRAYATAHP